MPNAPLFPNNYPGSGQFVILCEGDLTGYEATILSRWLRVKTPTEKIVDVRPCGTSQALTGMADAIGRSVRVIVIEDMDFRCREDAILHCQQKFEEREERNLAMRGWLCWSRNEIENYLLDDEVLLPAMKEVFDCSEDDARNARQEAIRKLVVFQAVQAAVCSTDSSWEELIKLRRIGGGRPKWSATRLDAPDPATVRDNLQQHIKVTQTKAVKNGEFREPLLGNLLLDTFDARLKQWGIEPLPEVEWKKHWAGKEILKLIRQQLAAQFSPPVESKRQRIDIIDWYRIGENIAATDNNKKKKLQEAARNALDRDIERAIQPILLKHLHTYLDNEQNADMNHDLSNIARCLVV